MLTIDLQISQECVAEAETHTKLIDLCHRSINTRVNTDVSNETNESSVPLRSKRVRVLLLYMLAHWIGSAMLH